VQHGEFIEQIRAHAEALRADAVEAGPQAPVPTCPRWDVHRLIDHLGKVYAMAADVLAAGAAQGPPKRRTPPEDWHELLTWWDDQRDRLLRQLTEVSPDAPAWVFPGVGTPTAGFWSRRQAHETAIHRLDAQHALVASTAPTAVPTLVFDSEFAADGIDEVLTVLLLRRDWSESTASGTALCHAADAGRAWTVRLRAGEPPHTGPVEGAGIDSDAVVAGTADALYRAVWDRPNTAVVSGNAALVALLKAP
jgi:uncharacterized protein (TIGR03083 family)